MAKHVMGALHQPSRFSQMLGHSHCGFLMSFGLPQAFIQPAHMALRMLLAPHGGQIRRSTKAQRRYELERREVGP